MSLDVAEHVTQCAIPVITKPFNLDNLLTRSGDRCCSSTLTASCAHTIQHLSTHTFA